MHNLYNNFCDMVTNIFFILSTTILLKYSVLQKFGVPRILPGPVVGSIKLVSCNSLSTQLPKQHNFKLQIFKSQTQISHMNQSICLCSDFTKSFLINPVVAISATTNPNRKLPTTLGFIYGSPSTFSSYHDRSCSARGEACCTVSLLNYT